VGWLTFSGCYKAKYYQAGKPFAFKNNIELSADVSTQEKKGLVRDLFQQLDDSLTPQVKDFLFVWHTLQSPAVYDTSYAGASLKIMHFYMLKEGFFSPEGGYTYKIDTVVVNKRHKKVQYRVTTTFHIVAGPRTLLDSIVEDLKDPELQALLDSSRKSTLLVRGEPFNGDKIDGEINRLINIYKNHGYYSISQDAFQVELDTTNPILINPTLDPLERIRQFVEQQKKQKNPTTDLYITLRPNLDSALLKKYYIRKVYIYPDFEITRDNRKTPLTGIYIDSVSIRYHTLKFKPSFLLRNTFLKPGDIYTQDNYNKSLNTLNFLGVWQVPIIQAREVKDTVAPAPKGDSAEMLTRVQRADSLRKAADSAQLARRAVEDSIHLARLNARVDSTLAAMKGDTTIHHDEDAHALLSAGAGIKATGPGQTQPTHKGRDSVGFLDFYYLLTPAKPLSLDGNLELNYSNNTSYSEAQNSIATGNIIGLDGDVGITHRNVGREAISMTNTVNGGVGLAPQYNFDLASVDLGYTNNITIPRFVTPFASINNLNPLAKQTVITSNVTYVERIGFFDLQSFNFKYGFQWKSDTNVTWSYNPIDVEYSYIYNRTNSFEQALDTNHFLAFAYTNALIMAQNFSYLHTYINRHHPNRISYFRASLETSGLLAGIAKRASNGDVFGQVSQYLRPTLEYRHEINFSNNNSWNFRLFSGVGIPLGGDSSLPFFKQFTGGGPNSMRGWAFRSLGPGSIRLAPDTANNFNDRFGDIQFEGNIEYRYNIAEIIPNSMYLKGAIFTDIGNVWDFRRQSFDPATHPTYDSATLDISHFYQELAVDAGVGLRLDLSYFVLRFDFGFRIKKPDEPLHDGWQLPDITFLHVFDGSKNNKLWRYNNYNFSFGINYFF